jgi:hypothetical protein
MPLAVDSADRLWAVFPSSDTDLTLASCAAECSEVSNWVQTHYSYAGAALTNCPRDLAIDEAGTVHMTTALSHVGSYAELLQGESAWSVYAIPFPFGYPFRMRIDAMGRPRILHAKAGAGNELESSALVYSSCDAGCASGGVWSSVTIPVPGGTAFPGDFVLDRTGAPRVVYPSPSYAVIWDAGGGVQALGYAMQGAADSEPTDAWQFETVQSSSILQTDTPTLGSGCNGNGKPVLAVGPMTVGVDTSGDSHVAFEVSKAFFCPVSSFGNGCTDGLRYASLTK